MSTTEDKKRLDERVELASTISRVASGTTEDKKQYAEQEQHFDRDGEYFLRHMDALERGTMRSNSEIAAALAWRDLEIAKLKQRIYELEDRIDWLYCLRRIE